MKFKYHLIRFLLIFVALFIPSAISTAVNMSGNSLGGLGILIVFTPFFYFIHCVYIGKVGPKLPQKTKEVDSIPITPEMLAASASDDVPEAGEEPMTYEERSKDIDACLQKAISDCAQGKISAKEFADICALLRQVENKPSILAQGVGKRNQQPTTEETYLVEDDNGFLVRVPSDKLDSWTAADHDAPLTPAEEQFKEKLLESIYRKTTIEDKAPVTEPKASKDFNQPKVALPPEQNRTVEKPIDCIPNSSHVPIPWWRNTRIMARMALGLIVAVLLCAIIFAIVPGLDPMVHLDANATPSPSANSEPPLSPSQSLSIQERLDHMEQGDFTNDKPLSKPYNGSIFYINPTYNGWVCPFVIDTHFSQSANDYYVRLRTFDTKEPIITFYVHSKSIVTVNVPVGLFELVYASGSKWYGEELLFGSDTKYYSANELFIFYDDGQSASGWELNILDGNSAGSFRICSDREYDGALDIEDTLANIFSQK